jgi:1-aminocyclopropane-1-carboxylate deaminase/D-cysteine desulfhydrase-like pyridoxal-dependent ACC family enzyme
MQDVALFRHFPWLGRRVPWVRLGDWPTPVEPLAGIGDEVWVKREDLSSPRYGGNKVRTLEAAMGQAVAAGAERIWATGAYGSNHATATALHAPAAGLRAGVALFPQRPSATGRDNLSAMLAAAAQVRCLRTVAELPLAMLRLRAAARLGGERAFVMPPGAATPEGGFGALSAGLELAEQVAAGRCPAPARIVLAVGSTCTTAGLLVGLHLAARLGVAFADGVPRVTAVRVAPWPITSAPRITYQATRTAAVLERLIGARGRFSYAQLGAALEVDGRFFGGGYGRTTDSGYRARRAFRDAGAPPLDLVYSAKSAAALLDRVGAREGPLLFWATKSSAPLPRVTAAQLSHAPAPLRRWLADAGEHGTRA